MACKSAVVTAGISSYNRIFILDIWAGRQGDPALLIDKYLQLAEVWQPRVIGIEGVAYQQALKPFTERRMAQTGKWFPIELLHPDRNEKKDQRILSMQPYFRSGQIYCLRGALDFFEEYESFPNGRTKDILDALAYAVRLLVPREPSRKPGIDLQLELLAKRDPSSARYWRADAVRRGELEPLKSIDDLIEESLEGETLSSGVGEFVS